jgi:hypothetical protein
MPYSVEVDLNFPTRIRIINLQPNGTGLALPRVWPLGKITVVLKLKIFSR